MRTYLPDFEEKEVYVRGKIMGDIVGEGGYVQTRLKIEESEVEDIEGRTALLKIYGYIPSEIRDLALIGNLKVKDNRIYVYARSEDVDFIKTEQSIRDLLMERYRKASRDKSVVPLGLSFLFGEPRELLPSSIQRDFLQTGLVHILVISGLHVGMIAFVLSKILPRFWGLKLALFGVLLYSLFIVPHNPPVLRASLMFAFLILSALTFRQPNSLAILLFSGTLILLVYPSYVFSYSFWLSFLATAYIILALKDLEVGKIEKTSIVSLSAFTGTAPLVATFSYLSPLSVVFTPLLAPVVLVFSFFGVLSLLTLVSFPPFVDLFNLSGRIFQGTVSSLEDFSFQIYPRVGFHESLFLSTAGLISLYFLKNRQKLIPLVLINVWLLLRSDLL